MIESNQYLPLTACPPSLALILESTFRVLERTKIKACFLSVSIYSFIVYLFIFLFFFFFDPTIIVLLYKLASIHFYSKVISVRVRNEIFRSGFFGAVVQFTHVLGNDVIEALTSDVVKTLPQADITK